METEGRLDPKLLYRRLDGLLGAFDPARPGAVLMRSFLTDAFRVLGDDLRLKAGTPAATGCRPPSWSATS